MLKLASDFKTFSRNQNDDNKEYVSKFSKLDTQLKNEKVVLPNIFLTGILLNKSNLSQEKKENLMATIKMDDKESVLKEMKKNIRDFKAMEKDSAKDPKETFYGQNWVSSSRNRYQSRSKTRSESERRYRKDNYLHLPWSNKIVNVMSSSVNLFVIFKPVHSSSYQSFPYYGNLPRTLYINTKSQFCL